MNELDETRNDFETWYSDNGESPKAIERLSDGEYKYMGASYAWIVWQAAARVTLEKAAKLQTVDSIDNIV